jgi:TolB protein
MRKLIFSITILLLAILLGCSPQVQGPPSANPPTPQPAEVAPSPQDNTETPVTTTIAPAKPQGKIAFVRDCGSNLNWDIFTVDSDGNNIIDITNKAGNDLWPSWSPDGKQITFQSSREWHGYPSIYVMDADGRNAKCLTPEQTACQFPAWSPNGKSIAYATSKLSLRGTKFLNIFTMDTNGDNKNAVSPAVTTSRTASSQSCPSWFPDSHKIAYASNNEGPWEICEVSVGNTVPDLLIPDTSESKRYHICIDHTCGLIFPPTEPFLQPNSFPALAVSPDGKTIVFDYRNLTGKRDIYSLSVDDETVKCLTCGLNGNSYFSTWSPDGSRIAFTLEVDGNTDIYIMNADGSHPALLVKNGMFPSWSR